MKTKMSLLGIAILSVFVTSSMARSTGYAGAEINSINLIEVQNGQVIISGTSNNGYTMNWITLTGSNAMYSNCLAVMQSSAIQMNSSASAVALEISGNGTETVNGSTITYTFAANDPTLKCTYSQALK